MKRAAWTIRLGRTALVMLGVVGPVAAQAPPQDLVPFKATLMASTATQAPAVVIPVSPPVSVPTLAGTGSSELLGAFTYLDYHIVRLGADGASKLVLDGLGVMTAANGDALFVTRSGLIRPAATGITSEEVFTVTGGRGRFLGATGSGTLIAVVDRVKNEVTVTWDGMISRPK